MNAQKQGTGQGVVTRPVEKDDDGARLDRWFKRHYPGVSHVQLEKLLRKGEVRLDGKRAKAGDRVAAGQAVRVPPQAANAQPRDRRQHAKPAAANHDKNFVQSLVIYRDSSTLVLNKPPGLATQGGSGITRHIDGMLDTLAFGRTQRPRLVHRLDRDTSGVLVVARTVPAAAALAESLRRRDASKIYWALTKGVPRPHRGTIKLALAKEGGHGPHGRDERMAPADRDVEGAKPAITDYAVMGQAGQEYAWLAVKPVTGRTHQIRVHLAAIGHPIVGDFKYGGAAARGLGEIADRLHLHARAIDIAHPDGGRLRVAAPLPRSYAEDVASPGLRSRLRDRPFYRREAEAEEMTRPFFIRHWQELEPADQLRPPAMDEPFGYVAEFAPGREHLPSPRGAYAPAARACAPIRPWRRGDGDLLSSCSKARRICGSTVTSPSLRG